MLELGSSGSVRGVLSNEHPYRHPPRVVIHGGNKIQEISHGEGNLGWRHRREIWLPRPGSSLFN
jgi:hypothetical protein